MVDHVITNHDVAAVLLHGLHDSAGCCIDGVEQITVSMHSKKVERLLKKGIDVRMLTMNPAEDNPFLKQRELEEGEPEGQIRKSIEALVTWANKLNAQSSSKGKIIVRGYKCMTLDFYWRVDDEMYIGPYWYGIGSQQTITYKFKKGKRAFELYEDYFEKLWADEENTILLTK